MRRGGDRLAVWGVRVDVRSSARGRLVLSLGAATIAGPAAIV